MPKRFYGLVAGIVLLATACGDSSSGSDAAIDTAIDTAVDTAISETSSDSNRADVAIADVGSLDAAGDGGVSWGKYLLWQSPGGIAGTGPVYEVNFDGKLRIWSAQTQQQPYQTPTVADHEVQLTSAELTTLETALQINFTNLPHPPTISADCYPWFLYDSCPPCANIPTPLTYNHAMQLRPEFDALYAFFDAKLATISSFNAPYPSAFCEFFP